jgi:hypothetical protein
LEHGIAFLFKRKTHPCNPIMHGSCSFQTIHVITLIDKQSTDNLPWIYVTYKDRTNAKSVYLKRK